MTSSSLHVVDDSFGEFCYFDIGLTWWMDLEVLALSQKLQLKLEGAQQTITTYMNMNIRDYESCYSYSFICECLALNQQSGGS